MGSFFSAIAAGTGVGAEDSSSEEPSLVTSFHSSARWQLHFNETMATPQLMVIDFAASWCGPCKIIEPVIKGMASKFTDVQFSKIDVDELNDLADEFQVQAMPTFVIVKKGKEVDRVVGAKKDELEKKIEKYRVLQAAA